MPPKVSIVVPTYAPGDRINGLVSSLEAQTLPVDEWEVIFVDDGSPDDTWKRLQRIQESHDNVRIERIENSGWPSRPRNIGIELALGEYVLFMDHDDELYPRALEAGYAMASRTGADVLNGKETRTDQGNWALDTYPENLDNCVDRTDVHPLIPTNPHKMFKRSMLMEHGIRFPEGRRVLWEDIFFALDVAPHAKVISNLSDTPFYHWVREGSTASTSYRRNGQEYWRWVREIVLAVNERLAAPELHGQWRLMLAHQYRSRVLSPVTAIFTADPDVRDFARATVDEIVRDHIPAELDDVLTPTQRGRAALLRAGRWDLLEEYIGLDSGLAGIGTASDVRWRDGVLELAVTSRWQRAGGKPVGLRFDGDRVVRDLPAHLAAELPPEALDVTDAMLAARSRIAIRARDTAVTWLLPGDSSARIETVDGRPELAVDATAVLDPATAAMGHPLEERSWDFTARNEFTGTINQRGLRTSTSSRILVADGHVFIGYRSQSGMLALDVDQKNRSLIGSAPPDLTKVVTTPLAAGAKRGLFGRRTSHRVALRMPFGRVVLIGETELTGTVTVDGTTAPARIVTRGGALWLETEIEAGRGDHPLTMDFGRTIDPALSVRVDARGRVTLVRPEKK